MAIQVTLKRIVFKAGRSEQPGRVAELQLMCDQPEKIFDLVQFISQPVMIDIAEIQQRLGLDEPGGNGTVIPSAGRRRRGTKAHAVEDE